MTTPADCDVMAYLDGYEYESGMARMVRAREIADATGLPFVTVTASLYVLAAEGRVDWLRWQSDAIAGRYVITGLYPDPPEPA